MGLKEQYGVMGIWDLNGTVLERADNKPGPLVDFTINNTFWRQVQELSGNEHLDFNQKMQHVVAFLQERTINRFDRYLVPNVFKWHTLPVEQKGYIRNSIERVSAWWEDNEQYDQFVDPYDLSPNGIAAMKESQLRGISNTLVSGMPYASRHKLKQKVSPILDYLNPEHAIILNPDLENVSGCHLKLAAAEFMTDGTDANRGNVFIVDDDRYILAAAEYLGFCGISSVPENVSKRQQHRFGDFEFPTDFARPNGAVIYGWNIREIPERMAA